MIFTTSYDHYAIRAFKVNSIDYILKPLDPGELYNAINKFEFLKHNYAEKTSPESKSLHDAIKMLEKKSYKERFIVKVGEHINVRWQRANAQPSQAQFCYQQIVSNTKAWMRIA